MITGKINFPDEIKKIWKDQSFGANIEKKELAQLIELKMVSLFSIGDYYYYFFNIKDTAFSFVSEGITKVLGYLPNEISAEFLLEKIHPEDFPYFVAFEQKVMEFFGELPIAELFNYKVRYDYRIRAKSGDYIRILQQVVMSETDENGSIVGTFGIHTDITYLKPENVKPILSIIGLNGAPSYENIQVEASFKKDSKLTRREQEIIYHLIEGNSSEEIAQKLFLSVQTVHTHRKNMLQKTGAKNTLDLIRLVVQNGWA
jgi:DNA-binding CsgD family transcriptional regulator